MHQPIPSKFGLLGVVIIDPGVDDHLGASVVAKKQAVLLKEFGTEPVLSISTDLTRTPKFNT